MTPGKSKFMLSIVRSPRSHVGFQCLTWPGYYCIVIPSLYYKDGICTLIVSRYFIGIAKMVNFPRTHHINYKKMDTQIIIDVQRVWCTITTTTTITHITVGYRGK